MSRKLYEDPIGDIYEKDFFGNYHLVSANGTCGCLSLILLLAGLAGIADWIDDNMDWLSWSLAAVSVVGCFIGAVLVKVRGNGTASWFAATGFPLVLAGLAMAFDPRNMDVGFSPTVSIIAIVYLTYALGHLKRSGLIITAVLAIIYIFETAYPYDRIFMETLPLAAMVFIPIAHGVLRRWPKLPLRLLLAAIAMAVPAFVYYRALPFAEDGSLAFGTYLGFLLDMLVYYPLLSSLFIVALLGCLFGWWCGTLRFVGIFLLLHYISFLILAYLPLPVVADWPGACRSPLVLLVISTAMSIESLSGGVGLTTMLQDIGIIIAPTGYHLFGAGMATSIYHIAFGTACLALAGDDY